MNPVFRSVAVVVLAVSTFACGSGGTVNGKAVDFAGNPLADAEVSILGTTFAGGEDVGFFPRTAADGTYTMEVPEGNYSVSASHAVSFDGKRYLLQLHPGDGKRGQSYPSKAGITQNFTLKVSGLRPEGELKPDQGFSYYGGEADFTIGDVSSESFQTNHFATEFPNGFTARVTFTPDGPLLDGSQGQPVVFEKQVKSKFDASFDGLDIPLGKYKVSAVAVKPDGATRTLKVSQVGPHLTGSLDTPADSAPFVFPPDSTGVRAMNVTFLYGAPYPAP